MTYTATTQGAQANPASVFMTSLDTLLVAAGFTYVETWPSVHVRVMSSSSIASLSGFGTPVDGVTLVDGDKVLLLAQTTASQNGLWVAHSGAWTRVAGYDIDGGIYVGLTVIIDAGTYIGYTKIVTATSATPWIAGTSTSTWATCATPPVPTGRIYKSPAGSNTQGADWFLCVYRTSDASTVVYFQVAEVWDTTKKLFRNYAPTSGSAPVAVTFAVNDTVGTIPGSIGLAQASTVNLSAAGFQYWVSANPNSVTVTTRVASTNTSLYMGLYDDILPVSISPFPLCVVSFTEGGAAGSGNGRTTREPGTTTIVTGNFGLLLYYVTTFTTDTAGIYLNSLIPARVIVCSSRVGNPAGGAIGARGFLKNVVRQTIVGAVDGDTIVVTDAASVTKTYTAVGVAANGIYWVDQGV